MRVSVLVLCGLMFADAAVGQRSRLDVDATKSIVHFGLEDPLHAVHGTFKVDRGSFTFDRATGAMSGKIEVNAASGESGSGARDKKMAQDELKAASFSEVTFAPKRFTGTLAATGESTITVEGVFTLVGVPHEITLPMRVVMEGTRCNASGSFNLPYVKWGLKDPSLFLLKVGKDVKIDLDVVGVVRPE